jgi:hypothetical protein
MREPRCAEPVEEVAAAEGMVPGTSIPGRETWDAVCEGGPRNNVGGGSRGLVFDLGSSAISSKCAVLSLILAITSCHSPSMAYLFALVIEFWCSQLKMYL